MIKEKWYTLQRSLKTKFIILYFGMLAPIFIVLIFSIPATQSLLLKQTISSVQDSLSIYIDSIDSSLNTTSSYLTSFLLDNSSTIASLSPTDAEGNHSIYNTISLTLQQFITSNTEVNGLFFYYPDNDRIILRTRGIESYYDRLGLKEYLRSEPDFQTYCSYPQISNWAPIQINDSYLLIQTAHFHNFIVGSWCSNSVLVEPLQDYITSTTGDLYISELTANPMEEFPMLLLNTSNTSSSQFKNEGTLIPVESLSETENYKLTLCLSKATMLRSFLWIQQTLYLLLLFLILCFGILFFSTWRQIIHPIRTLTAGMKSLQSGDFNVQLSPPTTKDEFLTLTKAFNLMSSKIKELKISIYEEKLQKKETELQYLSLQIKPHFFLNSLSVIHSLALMKRNDLILDLSSSLMNHLRYIFKPSLSFVTIEEEVNHMKNYLHIQELRYHTKFFVDYQIDPHLETAYIPVLCIHTFIENTVKHAFTPTDCMQVFIMITSIQLDQGSFLDIIISDNGKGFSKEDLSVLNSFSPTQKESNHIGIRNVQQRLHTIYGTHAQLVFSNALPKGAMVHLQLPFKINDKECLQYECTISR